MKKNLFAIVFLFLLCLFGVSNSLGAEARNSLVQITVEAEKHWHGDYEVVYLKDGTCAITDYKGYDYVLEIPRKLGGRTVSALGYYSFTEFDRGPIVSEVVVPPDVTIIDDGAFYYCENLRKAVLPSSVTSIGKDAFSYCYLLEHIVIPSSVTYIGENAFFCTGNKLVEIPPSVVYIGDNAFADCDTIVGFPGTAAEEHAKEIGAEFIAIGGK